MGITAVRTLRKHIAKTALTLCIALPGLSQERSPDYLVQEGQSREEHGEFAEAQRLFLEALHSAEQSPSPPLVVAGLLVNLAAVEGEQAHYLEAERHLLRALALAQRAAGSKSPAVASVLWHLIGVYADAGRLAQASPLLRQYQAIAGLGFEPDSLGYAESLGNLGRIYLARNDGRKALPIFQRAMEIVESHRAGNDMPFIRALLDRAAGSVNLGHAADALSDIQRAAAIESSLRDPPPQLEIDLQVTSALAYTQMARRAEAETCLNAALQISEAHYGPDHPVVAFVLRNWDAILRKFGRKAEASKYRERARRIMAANEHASQLGHTINAFVH
jgi:tetratricopeptide (TPR) repeat protein